MSEKSYTPEIMGNRAGTHGLQEPKACIACSRLGAGGWGGVLEIVRDFCRFLFYGPTMCDPGYFSITDVIIREDLDSFPPDFRP